jgi:hypothetical protein
MSKRTEIKIESKLSMFEHRFISGDAGSSADDVQEHRAFGVAAEHRGFSVLREHRTMDMPAEHRGFGALREHRTMDMPAEHKILGMESEHRNLNYDLDSIVLGQSTLKLSNPHTVSSVTVQRRSDGSFFLIIEE